jgi:trans-2-enoyl-CoA reductase
VPALEVMRQLIGPPPATAVVRETGGDIVLVDGEDLARRVIDATGGATIRLGIDAVGGTASGRLADSLCESATLVSYGRMCGEPRAIPADAFVFRDLTLRGFRLVNWFRRTPEHQRRVLVDEIAGLITIGTLHAPIHAIYDVTEIKEAVASGASGQRSGKILIVPRR